MFGQLDKACLGQTVAIFKGRKENIISKHLCQSKEVNSSTLTALLKGMIKTHAVFLQVQITTRKRKPTFQ